MLTWEHLLLVSYGIRVHCWKMVPKGLRQLRMDGRNYTSCGMEVLGKEYMN